MVFYMHYSLISFLRNVVSILPTIPTCIQKTTYIETCPDHVETYPDPIEIYPDHVETYPDHVEIYPDPIETCRDL